MFLFCTKPFPFQDCLQQVILTVRMKAFLLKSLIQISDRSISLLIFSLFQKYLEILKSLYSFDLKIPSILSADLKTVILFLFYCFCF